MPDKADYRGQVTDYLAELQVDTWTRGAQGHEDLSWK